MESAYLERDPYSAPQLDTSRASEKIVASQVSDSHTPVVFVPDSEKLPVSNAGQNRPPTNTANASPPQSLGLTAKRKWMIIAGVVLLAIIIAAATAGGVVGSRNRNAPSQSSSHATSTTKATSPTSTSGASTNNTVNDAWAYNGTGIFALSFNPTSAVSGTNYVVFYQHSNGDLRQVAYNYSQWHDSEYITDDARPGSPITAYWSGDNFNYNIFYADKNNVLQERRGRHGSSSWVNGTLGQLSVTASDPSDISVVFFGTCDVGLIAAWLLYNPAGSEELAVLYWNADTDTWTHEEKVSNVDTYAGFAGHALNGVWRYWYVDKLTSELKERVCPDCCGNSTSEGWRDDLTGATLDSPSGLSVTGVADLRLLYYGDEKGVVRELNNTVDFPKEAYVANVSSQADGGNFGTLVYNTTDSMPSGMAVATGIPDGRNSMASGSRGTLTQLWLFYQSDDHDISVQTRDSGAAGNWTQPSSIPVGIN
ncbi:hypothetical protein N7520_007400 [Penicillium odoratum]|uniref:uncharacterized protein n=1 Tax=Penicillium odoratum TaxID=1167516 RepID=UPI002549BCEB|nr:uncharacterized protein N7520_007400 [Penicillium odoratum]KAJ5760244.1 hypothetical protein N7520_007400 [Penicillium odoratum]